MLLPIAPAVVSAISIVASDFRICLPVACLFLHMLGGEKVKSLLTKSNWLVDSTHMLMAEPKGYRSNVSLTDCASIA